MTLNRVRILSPNYSSRGGATVRLIVLHTAEGALSYTSLGSYFQNPNSQVSSHVGIDDTVNTVGEYVDVQWKSWTAANANPVAVQAEMCAFASWSTTVWNQHSTMLRNCATWIAEESARYGIPIVKLSSQQAQSNGVGVCQHRDLGSWGGNHSDCGDGFPIDDVLAMARGQATTPQPSDTEISMFLAFATTDSANNPSIKKGYQYVIKEAGIATIATNDDSAALQAKLGPIIGLTGNQINSLK